MTVKRQRVLIILFSVLLAFCCSAAYDCMNDAALRFNLFFIIRWFVISLILITCFSLVLIGIRHAWTPPLRRIASLLFGKGKSHSFIATAAILFICWLPYLIAFFPGNLFMDTSGQLFQYIYFQDSGIIALNSKHPLFDTFVFGFIIDSVFSLTGNIHFGVFTLVLFQFICTIASIATFFVFANFKWECPLTILVILFLFCVFCPLFPIIACGVSKDSFYSWVYVLFFIAFLDIVICKTNGSRCPSSSIALLSASSFLMVLTKNTGVIIAFVSVTSLIPLFWQYRQQLYRIVLPALICVVIAGSLTYALPKAIGIKGGGAQEMLSIPFQQTALTLIKHGDEIPSDELEIISKVIEVESIETNYWPRNADGVKGYSPRAGSSAYADYIKVWFIEGFRYPKEYLEALVIQESPIFSDRPIVLTFTSNWTSTHELLPAGYNEKSEFNEHASDFVKSLYQWYCGVPVLKPFFITFFYAIFIPALLFISLLITRRMRTGYPIIVMILVSLAGLFVSPITGDHFEATRYLMPFIYTSPIVITMCSLTLAQNQSPEKKYATVSLTREAAASSAEASPASEGREAASGAPEVAAAPACLRDDALR